MITTIIFDLGNVLVDFAWQDYFDSFHFPEELKPRIAKATVLSPTWNEFDRGAESDEALVEAFVKNDPGVEKEIRKLCENIHDMLKEKDYALPWVMELKDRGYKVYYLSNFSRKAEIDCKDAIDFLDYMDGGILSYKEKLIKPEPKIYQLLIDRYQLVPEECIFLDDLEANCKVAETFGIHTIQFTTREAAIEKLKEYGIYQKKA